MHSFVLHVQVATAACTAQGLTALSNYPFPAKNIFSAQKKSFSISLCENAQPSPLLYNTYVYVCVSWCVSVWVCVCGCVCAV